MKSKKSPSIKEAIGNHDLVCVQELIAGGADLQMLDRSGNSLLHVCAQFGTPEIFEALVAAGLNLQAPNKAKNQPIHLAAASNQPEIVRLCLEHGCDPNVAGEDETPPLYLACQKGDVDSIRLLIGGGAVINGRVGYQGSNALFPAIQANRMSAVEALLDAGADIHHRQNGGWQEVPLEVACRVSPEMMDLLISRGADVNAMDADDRRTAVFTAIQCRSIAPLKLLHQHGAKLDYQDSRGKTPLMHAMWMDNAEMVDWLLDQGVDPRVVDATGLNALQIAQRPDAKSAIVLQNRLQQMGIALEADLSEPLLDQFRQAKAQWEQGKSKTFEVRLGGTVDKFVHLPDAIGDFVDLQRFSVSNSTNLLDVPETIAQWTQLQEWEFRNLRDFKTLSPGIGALTTLRKLILFYCWKLESIPDSIGELGNLEHLEIYGGKMHQLPASLSKLTKLKTVILVDIELEQVPDFSASKGLKTLKLNSVGLRGPMPSWILDLPNLTDLGIANNGITHIPKELLKLPLKKFSFKDNPLIDPPKAEVKGGFDGLKEWWRTH
jgi:ankyrin repeat protein